MIRTAKAHMTDSAKGIARMHRNTDADLLAKSRDLHSSKLVGLTDEVEIEFNVTDKGTRMIRKATPVTVEPELPKRNATLEELQAVLEAPGRDEWHQVNRNLMDVVDTKDEAFSVLSSLGYERISAEATIEDFRARLLEDPNDAFSWGEGAVEASGTVKLAQAIAYDMEHSPMWTYAEQIRRLEDRVIRDASYGPDSSTSKLSNLASDAARTAAAKLIQKVRERRDR